MSLRSLMRDTCIVLRPTPGTPTSWGEPTGTPTVVATVPCNVMEQGAEVTRAGGQIATADLAIHMPFGTDVTPDDRLSIDGWLAEVLSVNPVRHHHLLVRAQGVR